MEQMIMFFQLTLVAYFMSLGFGMIVGQGRGVQWVNNKWRTAVAWCIGTPLIFLGTQIRSFVAPAKKKRKKR
jgi:hypothetical protein